ncbi:DUF1850 domain-containing protein [Parapusillimonas sp. JC17]|uniref:DUF1850 domain-containing protein n=1 Tax=Parapusillimonas sp. JC17 TaxID=3445768 RepID=UPI003FA0BD6B
MASTLVGFGVCLALASAPDAPQFLPIQEFTLAWTHSIEKTRWEEDYTVVAPISPGRSPTLKAGRARIHGSAAGMEPPPNAVWHKGWYEYQPTVQPLDPLRLTRSGYTADYEWCTQGTCRSMTEILPSDGGVTLLYACR